MLVVAALLSSCSPPAPKEMTDAELKALPWDSVVAIARGSDVYWALWRGDPAINKYVDGFVTDEMQKRYGIKVITISGQGTDLYNRVLIDKQSGKVSGGQIDLMWINGETFHQLKTSQLLFGPFASRLPNYRLVDTGNAIIKYDFEQPTEGYESPWSIAQLALIYNSDKISAPPRTIPALAAWIKANPGKFTHDASFTGTTFLKMLLYTNSGGIEQFQGKFDSALYAKKSQELWAYLNELKPYFWRRGETYPEDVAKLHSLFANEEVYFTMSFNSGEADNKIMQGILPKSARAYVLQEGTIANASYQAIPFNAAGKAAAMVLSNFLLSPEAQYEKFIPAVQGSNTVLDLEKLAPQWREKFENTPGRVASVPFDTLRKYAKPEIGPGYHLRIHEDWRKYVLKAK